MGLRVGVAVTKIVTQASMLMAEREVPFLPSLTTWASSMTTKLALNLASDTKM
jgi:hypothetical protein